MSSKSSECLLETKNPRKTTVWQRIFLGSNLENKLLLISINFIPKTSHSCLTKMVHYLFSRKRRKGCLVVFFVVVGWGVKN